MVRFRLARKMGKGKVMGLSGEKTFNLRGNAVKRQTKLNNLRFRNVGKRDIKIIQLK